MPMREKFQTIRDLLNAADRAFAVGNALLATERLWDAVRHTLTTIAQEKGWPYADEEDLYQVAERLNERDEVGLDFLLSGYSAAQGYPDKVRYGFFDFADGDADDVRRVVHCFINLARELSGRYDNYATIERRRSYKGHSGCGGGWGNPRNPLIRVNPRSRRGK